MRHVRIALIVQLFLASHAFADAHVAPASNSPTADQAYRQLVDGQLRYVSGARSLPHQDEGRRCETTTGGQHPVAAVLSCADSRVPPELLFDQGIGDLFVIRVAGNVAATDELGTLEYGIEHLHIPLIVVLGHSRCGAVTAVVDGAHAEGNLAQLLKPIVPAADTARHDHPDLRGPALVSAAIQQNVRQAMNDLTARSPVLANAVAEGRVKVVGGVYDIHAGRVDWLGEPSLASATPASETATAAHGEPAAAPPHASQQTAHAAAAAVTGHEPADAHHSAAEHAADTRTAGDHAEPPHAANKPAAEKPAAAHAPSSHSEAAEPEAHAAPHASAAEPKADAPEPRAAATTGIAEHWPVFAGAVIASTLVGAGVTHFAARGKATHHPAAA